MEKILTKEVIVSVITLVVCLLLCIITKKVVYKIFNLRKNKELDGRKRTIVNLISNIITCVIVIFGIITILETFGIDTKSLIASFGVIGLVVGLALQDLLKDFIVGITIVFEGQYSIGDWVSINGFKGEVLPSSLRNTKLKAYTGEIKIISNRNITEIINYSMSKATLIIDIGVDYESDVDKVRAVLDKMCEDFKVKYSLKDISCLGVQELADSSIKFRLVATTEYLKQFTLDRDIKKEIVNIFNKNNIVIPFNQVVVHNGKRV